MKTARQMKADYSHLLGRVFPDRETLMESLKDTGLDTRIDVSRYRDISLASLGDFDDYIEVTKEEYEEGRWDNPRFYGAASDEEIVVAWQTSTHIEDVLENIIQNFVKGRPYYFRCPASESIPVQYITRGWRGTGPEETITWDLMEFNHYKIESLDNSVPSQFLNGCEIPYYISDRNHKYLTRKNGRIDKMRQCGVPLKNLRYRPVNQLGYYERLAIIARKIEEDSKFSLDMAQ